MKNHQKGFIVPLLLGIIALLVVGGGVYIYNTKKADAPVVVDTSTEQSNQVPTQYPESVQTRQQILMSLVDDWKTIAPNILPGFPKVSQAFYGYPDVIQFIGKNTLVISYQDDFNPLFAVLRYDSTSYTFAYVDGLRASPFKVNETLWSTWRSKYGDTSFLPETYKFSSARTGDAVYPSDWKLISENPFVSSQTSNTYTYTNHGFSIELPKEFVPHEEQAEGGPAVIISLPVGSLAYVTDSAFWEKWNTATYTYIKDEKFGDSMFKIYVFNGPIGKTNFYWLKKGNIGYEFAAYSDSDKIKIEDLLKTFKYVGWPQVASSIKISSLSSTSGAIGSPLTIHGSGFTGHDTFVWLDKGTEKGLLWGGMPTSDSVISTTISEKITMHAGLLCKVYAGGSGLPCSSWMKVDPGVYKIYIENANGKSNSVNFTVMAQTMPGNVFPTCPTGTKLETNCTNNYPMSCWQVCSDGSKPQ